MDAKNKKNYLKNPLAIILILALLSLGAYFYFSAAQTPAQVTKILTGPEAKALENKGLAEFDPSNDVVNTVSTEDKARYKEVYDAMQIGGNLKDKTKVQQSLTAINGLINKYPDYADLYVMRALYSLILGDTNYIAINSDLDNALNDRQSKKYISSYDSDTPIYLLKAKVSTLTGDTKTELDNFLAAINDPSKVGTSDFFGTGDVKADGNSNPTAPTLSDFDSLVQEYPNDFRTYMLRGLYYASFTTFNEQYYASAIADLNKAIALNPQSAEANYLLGELYMKTAFWTTAAASDISDLTGKTGGYKDQQRAKALTYFNQAIAADPNYKYAYAGASEANFELKNYADAIQDYSKEIELDPNNASAYNDKALAETNIDQFSQAITDLTEAIQLKEVVANQSSIDSTLDLSYQNRADAYVKAGDEILAIADYSKAIGRKFASQVFLMSVDQIRAIYPEFNGISDEVLLEGLRQKYLPNMTSTDFNSQMVQNKGSNDFILSDLYSARGDAYLKMGDKNGARIEYARAMHNDPQYLLKPDEQAVYGMQ